jgi:hypothetical protein
LYHIWKKNGKVFLPERYVNWEKNGQNIPLGKLKEISRQYNCVSFSMSTQSIDFKKETGFP